LSETELDFKGNATVQLTHQRKALELQYPFIVAGSSKQIADNIFLEIEDHSVKGIGEAAPSKFYNENYETVIQTFNQIEPLLSKANPFEVFEIMKSIQKIVPNNYAAKAAINIAILDLIGKKLNTPLYKLFGLSKNAPTTSYTIGIDNPNMIYEKIQRAKEYPILKIKLGYKHDYQMVEAIRELTNKPLRIDANEGWTKEEAVEKINWLETQDVEFVEQPLPASDLEGTLWVKERVNMMLFADESVKVAADIPRLIGIFDGINVKLMKCGGLTEAIKMCCVAHTHNMKTMIGCFIESSIGITAAAHIASLFDYVDLEVICYLKMTSIMAFK